MGGSDPYGPPPGQPGNYGPPGQQAGYGPPPGQSGGYGPPPGQAGEYGPPPAPPGNYGPPPGQPQQSKRKPRLIGGLILIVVLAVGGFFVIRNLNTSPDTAKVGECLTVKEFKNGTEPTKAGCDDPAANTKIGAKIDDGNGSCPTGDYDQYSVSGSKSYKLCLMINAKQGDCLANYSSYVEGYKKVSCADPAKDAEIVKVIDGTADKEQCEDTDATNAAVYSQPATTLCIKKNGA